MGVVVVGPWALRPAGGAGQPLLASLLCIDFCCSVLLRSAEEAPSQREQEHSSPASPASLLARLAQSAHSAAALAGPCKLHGTPECNTGAMRGEQPESPWRSTAAFTCSGFT